MFLNLIAYSYIEVLRRLSLLMSCSIDNFFNLNLHIPILGEYSCHMKIKQ